MAGHLSADSRSPLPVRLTEALPGLLRAVGVTGEPQVSKLAGDASARTYFRVAIPRGTFVAMMLAEAGPNSPAEEITRTARTITELPFLDVARYLKGRGVRVPEILGYDEARGVILHEDFGDAVLTESAAASPERKEPLYADALDQLERLAIVDRNDPRSSVAFSRKFDRDLYRWEFAHFVEYALDRRLKNPPAESDRQKIVDRLAGLIDEYLSWEEVFCHRDYHSRNLMVLAAEKSGSHKLGVLDFQDALQAPLFYDLASLLRDSYIDVGEDLRGRLIESYRRRMKPRKFRAAASPDEFRRAFDLMGLHRNLKAAGRFCYIDEVKKNPRYLADVPRTLSYVEETLGRYEDLKELRRRLLPYLPEVCRACAA